MQPGWIIDYYLIPTPKGHGAMVREHYPLEVSRALRAQPSLEGLDNENIYKIAFADGWIRVMVRQHSINFQMHKNLSESSKGVLLSCITDGLQEMKSIFIDIEKDHFEINNMIDLSGFKQYLNNDYERVTLSHRLTMNHLKLNAKLRSLGVKDELEG